MMKRLGVVMDPINTIHVKKDSTLAMLWEAQARGYEIYYFEQKSLFLADGVAYGEARRLVVSRDVFNWFELKEQQYMPLSELDVLLMRKDPPFNQDYIYTTYILEKAEGAGVLVVNKPQALRDANEKLFSSYFPQCCPPSLVTQSVARLKAFWKEYKDIVCKPLDSMGGNSVFRLQENEVNATVILETLTQQGNVYILAQQFIPEISAGDKRIILVDGEVVPHALVRVPQGNEWRGNLAVGAKGMVLPLTERDHWICTQIAPTLRERGLMFVGIDIIGDYLTEINVTSPTGIREIDDATGGNISALLMDAIEKKL